MGRRRDLAKRRKLTAADNKIVQEKLPAGSSRREAEIEARAEEIRRAREAGEAPPPPKNKPMPVWERLVYMGIIAILPTAYVLWRVMEREGARYFGRFLTGIESQT